jgi:hypothetical protein
LKNSLNKITGAKHNGVADKTIAKLPRKNTLSNYVQISKQLNGDRQTT